MSDRPTSDKSAATLPQDEAQNPVLRLGRAVAGLMLLVWAGVLALVFYLVFRFWLS